MHSKVIKYQIGKTPLVRAKNLEKELGVGKIYLKLEGNNPSGHREDRLAYLLIKDAISKKKKTLCMGTTGTIGASLAVLSGYFKLNTVFVIPMKEKLDRRKLFFSPYVELIEYGETYWDCVKESRKLARMKKWYDANPGLSNSSINLCAFSPMSYEISEKLNGEIDSIFCQTSNGFAISGVHFGFKEMMVRDVVEKLPRIYACTTSVSNAIAENYKKKRKIFKSLDCIEGKPTRYNRHMINLNCTNGQDALNAIYDSSGKAIAITDDELREYHSRFKKLEKIKVKIAESFPIAAFIKEAESGRLKGNTHVIILNNGKIDLELQELTKKDMIIEQEEVVEGLVEWLGEYGDSPKEIKEAVDNAVKDGFLICAFHANNLVGAAVVINTGFSDFATNYHLSYIATHNITKGKGIATQILERAIELTKGNLSLHVEFDNKRAVSLYEMMGFSKSYLRMIHKGKGVIGKKG